MTQSINNVHMILNPVSGDAAPDYDVIGRMLGEAPIKTTLHITKEHHSASACVQDALDDSAELVITYGGDGTVAAVASALHGHDVPMAIVPGGTANVISHELNIPQDTAQALELALGSDHAVQTLDAGRVNDAYFLLRTSIGWEAELSRRPSRESKASWGPLAYTQAALAALQDMTPVTYHITLDDETEHTIEGINCSVCNIGNVGLKGISISLDIEPDDGLLNVLILQNENVQAMVDITQNLLASSLPMDIEESLPNYRARKITIRPDPEQRISQDGEPLDCAFPMTFECVPDFISILTPQAI